MNLDDATAPACTICHRGLYEHELTHQACQPCAERIDLQLMSLAGPGGLYDRLGAVLAPGATASGPAVSGSRTAPTPCRLEPLSLSSRGGVVTILQTWLIDWHEQLGYHHPRWDGGLQQQLDQVVQRLRVLLTWAIERHEAIDEFASEVRQLVNACRAQVDGEKPPRRVHVECPCGQRVSFTLDTLGLRCPNCQTQYGHGELLRLPLAERRAA